MRAGTRVVSLVAFTKDLLVHGGIEADFRKLRPLCDAREAVVTTPGGTDLRLNLEGRPGNSHPCIVDKPGEFTKTPGLEASIAPVEGEGEGVIVFDGSIPNLRMGVVDARSSWRCVREAS